ncbi:hypothetical protein [Vibrio sp. TBV020]
MYNDYIKQLYVKSYQEEISRQYVAAGKETFHAMSFSAGFAASMLLFILF